jgi:hypothetical protein
MLRLIFERKSINGIVAAPPFDKRIMRVFGSDCVTVRAPSCVKLMMLRF